MVAHENSDTVFFVKELLRNAIDSAASDIHIEPQRGKCRIRLRIQGVLRDIKDIEIDQALACIRYIKVLSDIDMSERKEPRDGSFQFEHAHGTVDIRISLFPSIHGTTAVLRILDRSARCKTLDALGMHREDVTILKTALAQTQGAVITSGPTGAGKTTTLYACLPEIYTEAVSIITLEDPVEYEFSGITQGNINPKAGLTFEAGLRSLLRQDPDIILLGEIRDAQTAQTAMHAALTGHLLLSTIHARDTINVIMRLIEMGVEPYVLNACLSVIIAQRLVQVLCEHCKATKAIDSHYRSVLDRCAVTLETDWHALGCSECGFTGIAGRRGIFELISVDDELRNLIASNHSRGAITDYFKYKKVQSLADRSLELVQQGIVSLRESVAVMPL